MCLIQDISSQVSIHGETRRPVKKMQDETTQQVTNLSAPKPVFLCSLHAKCRRFLLEEVLAAVFQVAFLTGQSDI